MKINFHGNAAIVIDDVEYEQIVQFGKNIWDFVESIIRKRFNKYLLKGVIEYEKEGVVYKEYHFEVYEEKEISDNYGLRGYATRKEEEVS